MSWDIFVSYASEDEAVVVPIVEALQRRNMRVWFDRIELRLNDSLREKIDYGLANARYGVLILSPRYFAKAWTLQELNGLVAREHLGAMVILPVWHEIDTDEVAKHSPILADRLAAKTKDGTDAVADMILRAVQAGGDSALQNTAQPYRDPDSNWSHAASKLTPPMATKLSREEWEESERLKLTAEVTFDGPLVANGLSFTIKALPLSRGARKVTSSMTSANGHCVVLAVGEYNLTVMRDGERKEYFVPNRSYLGQLPPAPLPPTERSEKLRVSLRPGRYSMEVKYLEHQRYPWQLPWSNISIVFEITNIRYSPWPLLERIGHLSRT